MTNMETDYLINPETGRPISVGGPAYQKLLDMGYSEKQLRNLVEGTRRSPSKAYDEDKPSEQLVEKMSKLPKRQQTQRTYENLPPHLEKRKQTYKSPSEGRGSRTRGWSLDKPKRGSERHLLRQKCGDACFLIPERESFPICAKCQSAENCACEIDCRGVNAAKVRAKQWKYTNLYQTIDKLQKDKQCK